jgi:signal transduction histidine kinase
VQQWAFYLTAGFLFGAALLRGVLLYGDGPQIGQVLALMGSWLALLLSQPALSRWRPGYFPVYLVLQTGLIVGLLSLPEGPDYFAALLVILSIQMMQHLRPWVGAMCIGVFALLVVGLLAGTFGFALAVSFGLIYSAANIFVAYYSLAAQRAQAARAQNHALARELDEANRQLQAYSKQLEQLAVARERNQLARDLHDSVTQTIFSMTLTTQSALLLMERQPGQVAAQLDRLTQLAQSALAEMRVLISKLQPAPAAQGGLAQALRRHLADGRLPETLSVSLKVDGDQALEPAEEQALFRIAQEGLNNTAKHAQATQAHIRLHLKEPMWMEIQDHGRGFDLGQAGGGGHLGLAGMRERAAEIGWRLEVVTAPGAGTRLRVEKVSAEERRP